MTLVSIPIDADPRATPAPSVPVPSAWPGHLLPPGPCGWTWWRDAVLRSAGFPADGLARLSTPALGALADDANRAEQALRAVVSDAQADLRERVDALRRAGDGADRVALRALGRAQKRLNAWRDGTADDDAALPEEIGPDRAAAVRTAAASNRDARVRMVEAHAEASSALGDAVSAFAADPLFRSAVSWQNLEAVLTALDPLAAGADMAGSKRRQREALVANYVQRYCAKNDSIGFFGPLAWMRIEDDAAGARFEVGDRLVRSRSVHFEDWAIEALAARIAADDRYLPWLVAYRQPYHELVGRTLRLPGGATVALDEREAVVLAWCDGVHTVRSIARAALADPFGPFHSEHDVHAVLRQLERSQRVRLAFQVPSCGDDPDRPLRRHLQRIDDEPLRDAALAGLDALTGARARIEAAADDPQALAQALQLLHDAFDRVVGGPHRRKQGEVYGGRSLVYEDCHRDLSLSVAAPALAPALDALELVVTGARWFTLAAWRRFHAAFALEFDGLCATRPGALRVPLPDLWLRIQATVFGDQVPLDDLADELRDRWEALLLPGAGESPRRIDLALDAMRERVLLAFPCDGEIWRLGNYHCPDVMFCAKDEDALMRGEFLAVMGEVHIGGNTVATNLFASQHPDRARLLDALRSDLGERYAMPKLSPEASGTPTRTQWVDDPVDAQEIAFSRGFIPANPRTSMPAAALDVLREGDELVVRHRDGDWQVPLRDALGDFLFISVINRFGMMHKRAHMPRVTLGRLVVQREAWTFQATELAFARVDDDAEAFRQARAWKSSHGLPDAAFVKMSWEAKPVFVDFLSVVSMRMLAKQVRHAAGCDGQGAGRLTFSELLPAFDELWLRDAQGRRYTSELRLVGLHAEEVRSQVGRESRP
jgi:hypothetical protein